MQVPDGGLVDGIAIGGLSRPHSSRLSASTHQVPNVLSGWEGLVIHMATEVCDTQVDIPR